MPRAPWPLWPELRPDTALLLFLSYFSSFPFHRGLARWGARAMALFPTRAEAMAWQSISELVTWAGLNIDAFKAFEEVVGHLGSNIRNVALLPADAIVAAGTYAKLNGAALHPIQIVQWGLVWRLARRIALTAEGGPAAWDDYIDVDPFAPPPASTAPPAAPAAAAAKGRIVKMAE
eukprot:684113-Pyramimonas_sp.AAC.1